jgi:hypothetical protein
MADNAFDFFSPFFRAAIITDPKDREGSRWPLWVFGSEQESNTKSQTHEANGLGALAFVTEVTVKLTLAYIPTITVTLSPPLEDARRLLDSPLIEYAKGSDSSLIQVQFGYTNGPDGQVLTPPFEGSIIAPPSVSFGADASITLTGTGTGGFKAQRAEVSAITEKKKRIDLMDEVLSASGIEVNREEVKPETAEGKALDEEIAVDFASNSVAWFYVVDLALTCGCWVTLTTKDNGTPVAKLTAVNAVLSQEPKLKFRFYDFPKGMLDSKTGVFPILSISTPTTSVFMSGAAAGLRTMSYDSKTREIKASTIDDSTAAPKRTGDGTAGAAEKGQGIEGDFFSENAADPAQQKRGVSLYQQAQGTQGVQIEVETIGIPTLVPGAFISVAGVAKRLDQNYVVNMVEHSIGSGGYSTKFTAYANVSPLSGTPAAKLNSAVKTVANPNPQTKNEQEPQATSSSTVTVVPKGEK